MSYKLRLDKDEWVTVDMVGRTSALSSDEEGFVKLNLTSSPVYILKKANYNKLTKF